MNDIQFKAFTKKVNFALSLKNINTPSWNSKTTVTK